VPIARRVLAEAGGSSDEEGPEDIAFEPLFYFVLLHEVSHGLGPAYRADGRSVDNCLGAAYTSIEEAKADTGGLDLLLSHNGQHGIPGFDERQILRSYTATLFRGMRFGVHEAHGAANVIEHNWLKAHGGIESAPAGYEVHPEDAKRANRALLEELCRIQAEASEKEAAAFLERWARPDEELERLVESLDDLPIDLFLEF
jgi:hypothetical protein